MSELDLIPGRYHRRRRLKRGAGRMGLVYLAAAVLLVAARLWLARGIAEHGREIENLRLERARVEQESRELARLSEKRTQLEQRLAVLEGLRGGVAAKGMFTVVDEALDESVWFRQWSFRRAGEIVDESREAVETGYFIVLPQESKEAPRRAWRLETHMEISAEAEDHAALARFVRHLSEQPEIESARILNTQSQRADAGGRVDFELAVLVRSTQ